MINRTQLKIVSLALLLSAIPAALFALTREVTTTANAGLGSLRQAITDINSSLDTDNFINFNIICLSIIQSVLFIFKIGIFLIEFKQIKQEINWAITVAIAAPDIPKLKTTTNKISRIIFIIDAVAIANKGVLLFPRDLKIDDNIL